MSRSRAGRARNMAMRALAYRAWYLDPACGIIPSPDVLTDRGLQRRELQRQLRRAQFGLFDTIAPNTTPRIASAF